MKPETPVLDAPALLREVPIFAELSDELIGRIAEAGHWVEFEAGEIILGEGDYPPGMYVVAEGEVRKFLISPKGRELTTGAEHRGGVISMVPLLDGGGYPQFAIARTRVRLFMIPREGLEELLATYPELSRAAIRYLARRVRELFKLVEEISLKEVIQRLAGYLLKVSHRRGSRFELTVTQDEIAMSLGTVREIVSRNFSRLRQLGLIEIKGREVVILDPAGLRKIAEGEPLD